MRRAAKIDQNQPDIVAALRSHGCSVVLLSKLGQDCPDLLVAKNGNAALVEVKFGRERLTPGQASFLLEWRGRSFIARTVDDAIEIAKQLAA